MEVIVLMGLQASGKTSFYRARFAATHAHVSKDLLRNSRRPARRQGELIEAALRAGRSVVVDNTHPAPADRAEVIAQARAHGARVVGYWFPPDLAASRRRNAGRQGRARVPDVALHVTARRLQPPAPGEGFDALFAVRPVDGDFEVTPWP